MAFALIEIGFIQQEYSCKTGLIKLLHAIILFVQKKVQSRICTFCKS